MDSSKTERLTKYWVKVKENIKQLYMGQLPDERGKISKRYNLNAFRNNFTPVMDVYDEIDNKCICGQDIHKNYKYYHKEKGEGEYFILGSCCIKLFSKAYEFERTCTDCKCKMRVNNSGRCPECRADYKLCRKCHVYISKEIKHCNTCCKEIKKDYMQCYRCRFQ